MIRFQAGTLPRDDGEWDAYIRISDMETGKLLSKYSKGPFKTQELARTTAYEVAQTILNIKGVKAEALDKKGWTQ